MCNDGGTTPQEDGAILREHGRLGEQILERLAPSNIVDESEERMKRDTVQELREIEDALAEEDNMSNKTANLRKASLETVD